MRFVFLFQLAVNYLIISDRSKQTYRPNFSTKGLHKNISAYMKRPRMDEFWFGVNNRSASMLIKNNSYLSRGHLSPDADFVLATAQFTTYYYINIALQWYKVLYSSIDILI